MIDVIGYWLTLTILIGLPVACSGFALCYWWHLALKHYSKGRYGLVWFKNAVKQSRWDNGDWEMWFFWCNLICGLTSMITIANVTIWAIAGGGRQFREQLSLIQYFSMQAEFLSTAMGWLMLVLILPTLFLLSAKWYVLYLTVSDKVGKLCSKQ